MERSSKNENSEHILKLPPSLRKRQLTFGRSQSSIFEDIQNSTGQDYEQPLLTYSALSRRLDWSLEVHFILHDSVSSEVNYAC